MSNTDSKTNFEKVREFHQAFEQPAPSEMQFDIAETNRKLCDFRISLIEEEFNELKDAIKTNNFIEIRDAIADILYVVYGTAVSMGINADADFAIVHESNMSKLCDNEEDAKATVLDYERKIAEGKCPYKEPVYIYRADIGKFIVKDKPTGKVLKNIKYKKVKW
jgi:predicted HAD superfamily Cof-like phosphohydrolase